MKKFFPCLGNPAHPRAAVPPLMKKKSRQIRVAGIQPVTGEEGPESDRSGGQYAPAWRSPFPRQENTQTGANGVFLKPRQHAAAAPGHQRPAFARIKKQTSHINSFFRKAAGPLYGKVGDTAYTVPDTRSRRRGRAPAPRTAPVSCPAHVSCMPACGTGTAQQK